MGRGQGSARVPKASAMIFAPVPRRTDLAVTLAESDPKAFYILFEMAFAERLKSLGKRRMEEIYPPPGYDLEILLPGSAMPAESYYEELLEEQDDELFIAANVLSADAQGNWGSDCSDGFYMSPRELLDLGWHRDGTALQRLCIRFMGGWRPGGLAASE